MLCVLWSWRRYRKRGAHHQNEQGLADTGEGGPRRPCQMLLEVFCSLVLKYIGLYGLLPALPARGRSPYNTNHLSKYSRRKTLIHKHLFASTVAIPEIIRENKTSISTSEISSFTESLLSEETDSQVCAHMFGKNTCPSQGCRFEATALHFE